MNYYYYYYYYVQLTAVFQLNLGQPVPLLHLFQKRTPGDKWNGFYGPDALPGTLQ